MYFVTENFNAVGTLESLHAEFAFDQACVGIKASENAGSAFGGGNFDEFFCHREVLSCKEGK